jgi:hypothetical protein
VNSKIQNEKETKDRDLRSRPSVYLRIIFLFLALRLLLTTILCFGFWRVCRTTHHSLRQNNCIVLFLLLFAQTSEDIYSISTIYRIIILIIVCSNKRRYLPSIGATWTTVFPRSGGVMMNTHTKMTVAEINAHTTKMTFGEINAHTNKMIGAAHLKPLGVMLAERATTPTTPTTQTSSTMVTDGGVLGMSLVDMTTPTTITTHHLAMVVVVGVVAMEVEITAIRGPTGTVAGQVMGNGERNLVLVKEQVLVVDIPAIVILASIHPPLPTNTPFSIVRLLE